ncbi:MAG: zinc-ribbon domain-containing protein, partial [Deltaproteobacteria bacterium]|nr:zinc-ribbon domain-containing protein [Deltaproteobacteria bacterium]
MHCTKCGTQNADQAAAFCPQCGNSLRAPPVAKPSAATKPITWKGMSKGQRLLVVVCAVVGTPLIYFVLLQDAFTDVSTGNASNARAVDAYNAGVSLYTEGKKQDSVAKFREAIEADAKMAQAYNSLAIVYSETGRDDLAYENYSRYVELDPNGAHAARAKEFLQAYKKK